MTTIAYHHGDKEIAIDSRACAGGLISTEKMNKVVKNNLGTWFLCGSVCDIADFVKLTKNEILHKDLELTVSGLRMNNDTVASVFIVDGVFCEEIIEYSVTLGSGCDFALAAMNHGKSAKEAVKYAMTRDVYTGGRIRVFNVKD
jgi:hypothetical protein